MFQRAWKVFRKFCPPCYKQVIALSPRRIKDKFHLYFQSFHKFCENFENTRENLSLIILGLVRLHILIVSPDMQGKTVLWVRKQISTFAK